MWNSGNFSGVMLEVLPWSNSGTGCHAKREVVSDKMLLAEVLPLEMEPIKNFLDLISKLCVELLV